MQQQQTALEYSMQQQQTALANRKGAERRKKSIQANGIQVEVYRDDWQQQHVNGRKSMQGLTAQNGTASIFQALCAVCAEYVVDGIGGCSRGSGARSEEWCSCAQAEGVTRCAQAER